MRNRHTIIETFVDALNAGALDGNSGAKIRERYGGLLQEEIRELQYNDKSSTSIDDIFEEMYQEFSDRIE